MKAHLVNESEIRKRLREIDDLLHAIREYKSSNQNMLQNLRKKDKELNCKKETLEKERDILENVLKLSHGK